MTKRIYVGIKPNAQREPFITDVQPTEATHGTRYNAVIGPFRTKRAAIFLAQYGTNNPHVQTVADAERIARQLMRFVHGSWRIA